MMSQINGSTSASSNMRKIQNYTPSTYATQKLAVGKKRKRQGYRLSCHECRRQKIKCDRGHPCESCQKQGPRIQCVYGDVESEGQENGHLTGSSPDSVEVAHVAAPLENGVERSAAEKRIESMIERLARNFDNAQAGQPSVSPASRNMIVRMPGTDLEQGVPPGNDSVFVGMKHQAGVVVGLRQGVPFYIGMSGWCVNHYSFEECGIVFKWPKTFGKQWASYGELKNRFKDWRQPSLLDALPMLTPASPSEADLTALVPDEATCSILISRFLSTVNIAYPIIDPETLKVDAKEFWKSRKPVSSMWLACFVVILGIGYQLPVVSFPDEVNVPNGQTIGKDLVLKASQFVFSAWQNLRRPDTVTFQTILLLVVVQKLYMEHPDGCDPINGLLSFAGKMAFSMGLHRDPVIIPDVKPADIRLRQRLWSIYLFCDFEHCIHTGMPFTLRSSDYDTLDPDSLDNGLPCHGSTYQQCLFDAVPIWAEVVHLTHSTKVVPTNAEIFELDGRLRKIDVLPWMSSGDVGTGRERLLAKAIQNAVLDCLNNRMRSILNYGMLEKSDPKVRRHATAVLLHSAMSTLNHQEHITTLVEGMDPATQPAWAHFVLSILRFNFFSACKDILFLLRESINGRIPIPGGPDLQIDEAQLFQAVSSEEKLFEQVLPLSMSCIKERVMFFSIRDGVRERLRICRQLNRTSIDLHDEEAKPIIQAMQRGMDFAINSSREAIDAIVSHPDPPPALAEWLAQRAAATSSQDSPYGDVNTENMAPMDWGQGAEDLMPMTLWMPDLPELSWPFSETDAQDPGWWSGFEDSVEQPAAASMEDGHDDPCVIAQLETMAHTNGHLSS